jgi:hypothetical protein
LAQLKRKALLAFPLTVMVIAICLLGEKKSSRCRAPLLDPSLWRNLIEQVYLPQYDFEEGAYPDRHHHDRSVTRGLAVRDLFNTGGLKISLTALSYIDKARKSACSDISRLKGNGYETQGFVLSRSRQPST